MGDSVAISEGRCAQVKVAGHVMEVTNELDDDQVKPDLRRFLCLKQPTRL